jgi:hypothetical protein
MQEMRLIIQMGNSCEDNPEKKRVLQISVVIASNVLYSHNSALTHFINWFSVYTFARTRTLGKIHISHIVRI